MRDLNVTQRLKTFKKNNLLTFNFTKIKKLALSLVATLLISSIAIAKCHTINFGLGSYTWGTYTKEVTITYYSEAAGTFVQEVQLKEFPCNGGEHWDWIWD